MGEYVKAIKSIELELPQEMSHLEKVLVSLDENNLWTGSQRKLFPALLIFDPSKIPNMVNRGEFYDVKDGSVHLSPYEASHLRLRAKDELYMDCNEQSGFAAVYNNSVYSKYFPNN